MIAMDKVHSIRQLFYEQGKSVSAIAAETGHDRKTVYYGKNVPLFRRNGYRMSGAMIP